jgi:hypothetical protein
MSGDPFEELTPFAVIRRSDGEVAIAARATGSNVISVAPLRLLPPPPRRRLFYCPCRECGRPFILSEFRDGHSTLVPLSEVDTSSDDGIPFG